MYCTKVFISERPPPSILTLQMLTAIRSAVKHRQYEQSMFSHIRLLFISDTILQNNTRTAQKTQAGSVSIAPHVHKTITFRKMLHKK
jgi:hypothetical protein